MKRVVFTMLAFSVILNSRPAVNAAERPNIVLILADDFGVGDIQAHYPKNKIPTPHLDRLVRQGMSFGDAHSPSSVCSPTRYGLLTGRYCWRTRLQEWVIAAYEPPLISPDRPTLPGFMKQHGYHTACIGKWHLGWHWPGPQPSRMTIVRNGQKNHRWDFTKAIRGGPTERGFDYYWGVDLPNLPPFTYIENDRVVAQPSDTYRLDSTEGVVLPRGFVGAPMAPGWRMQKILPDITERAVNYVRTRARMKSPFFLYFSLTSPHEPVVPSRNFRGKSGIAPIADFVMETDWAAGQVIKAIDESGIAENTIVIFTADNGHSHYTGWQQLVDAGHLPSGEFRGHKGDIWEGGHRVPLVVRWPNRIKVDARSSRLVSLTDIFATCADAIQAELPKHGAEDSLSFLPSLLGQKNSKARTTIVNHSNHGEFAYREGRWKLVYKMARRNLQQSRGKETIAELYDLDADAGEKNDASRAHPELVRSMRTRLNDLVERGATRTDRPASNDTLVRFGTIQTQRWAAASQRQASLVVAHRGLLRHAPENTLANFRACLELKLGFEFDVQVTKDGRLVCIHDTTVDRTTGGSGGVSSLTLQEIRSLDAGRWFDARFSGEKVPTVDEVLKLVAEYRTSDVLIAVDLKNAEAAERVAMLASKHKVLHRLLFIGRTIVDPKLRERIKKVAPTARTAAVANTAGEFPSALSAPNATSVYFRYLPTREEIRTVHDRGKQTFIAGTTVSGNAPGNWTKAANAGMDAILTDYPLELLRQLRAKPQNSR